jgi:hypothetical protein
LGLTWDNETIKQVFDLMIRTPIVDPYLRRRNAIHRFNLRQIEKNRFPVKCGCVVCGEGFLCGNIEDYLKRQYYLGPDKAGNIRHVCWGCDLTHKVRVAAGTLYNLVCAIPVAERDGNEIYPNEIPVRPEEKTRQPGCGLSDYAGPARLLTKFGRHELVIRQNAGSPVRNILTITSDLVDLPAIERRLALYLWGRLTPPEAQQTLKRIGRLYRNSCWLPRLEKHCLFDKAEASSWKKAQLWKPGQRPFEWDPKDLLALEGREIRQILGGVFVAHAGYWDKPFWLRSHKRHADLARTRTAYNDQHGSCWNSPRDNLGRANLTKTFRALGSINMPRDAIEARNGMIANLERDFAPRNEREAA